MLTPAEAVRVQQRFERIYPALYKYTETAEGKIELTQTLQALTEHNARKKVMSLYEQQFHQAYLLMRRANLSVEGLNRYFKALGNADIAKARGLADDLLNQTEEPIRSRLVEDFGVYPSEHPRWVEFADTKTPNLIPTYSELDGNLMTPGMRVSYEGTPTTAIDKLAQRVYQKHEAYIATFPEELGEKAKATFRPKLTMSDRKTAKISKGPAVISPESDLNLGNVSMDTQHELRHLHYYNQRKSGVSGPVDTMIHAVDTAKPLNNTNVYSIDQPYEEITTHAQDLRESIRAGNREILRLYTRKVDGKNVFENLPLNQVIDTVKLIRATNRLHNLNRQTIETAEATLKSFEAATRQADKTPKNFSVFETKEGYAAVINVDNRFYSQTLLSSPGERKLAEAYLAKKKMTNELNVADRDLVLFDSRRRIYEAVMQKLNRSINLAKQIDEDAQLIYQELDRIIDPKYNPNGRLSYGDYLKLRDAIIRPTSRGKQPFQYKFINGKPVRVDPE